MLEVLVLIDEESRHSPFLSNLGQGVQPPEMCRVMTADELKVFTYETFGLMTPDPKINQFLPSRAGVIIIIQHHNVKRSLLRLIDLVRVIPRTPILFVIEKSTSVNESYLLSPFLIARWRQVCYTHSTSQIQSGQIWFTNEIQLSTTPLNSVDNQTSLTYTDDDLCHEFQNCTLPMKIWDHYGRLRIVSLSLAIYGLTDTLDLNGWLCVCWKNYKTSLGHGHLWHYTLTCFWARLIHKYMSQRPDLTFEQVYQLLPLLSNGSLYKQYYTDAYLMSPEARQKWIEPDLQAI